MAESGKALLQIEIVSSEEQIYSGEASFVVVPTLLGELGILPHHTPIMSLVKPGLLRLIPPNSDEELMIAVSGGLVEVQPNKVTVLAEVAVRSEELDEARAAESKQVAEAQLKQADTEEQRQKAEAALDAAIAELKALDYIKTHHK